MTMSESPLTEALRAMEAKIPAERRAAITDTIAELATSLGATIEPSDLTVYVVALADVPLPQLGRAAAIALQRHKYASLPLPAVLREWAGCGEDALDADAEEAYARLYQHASARFKSQDFGRFENAAWRAIRGDSLEDVPWDHRTKKPAFLKAYKRYRLDPESIPPAADRPFVSSVNPEVKDYTREAVERRLADRQRLTLVRGEG